MSGLLDDLLRIVNINREVINRVSNEVILHGLYRTRHRPLCSLLLPHDRLSHVQGPTIFFVSQSSTWNTGMFPLHLIGKLVLLVAVNKRYSQAHIHLNRFFLGLIKQVKIIAAHIHIDGFSFEEFILLT